MTAVILPAQLSAKSIPSENPAADAAAGSNGTLDGMPALFSELLAQQIGLAMPGQGLSEFDSIDLKGKFEAEALPIPDEIANLIDTGMLTPQELAAVQIPQAAPVNTPLVPQEPNAEAEEIGSKRSLTENISSRNDPAASVDFLRNRQFVAVDSAAIADAQAAPSYSTASTEAMAGQAVRQLGVANVNLTQSTPQPVAGAISQPVSSPAWGSVLGDRVMWMVGQQQQGAEIRLNPPALGPLEIKLSMNDGQATLTFSTQHLPVKEALEAATPRLREMFGESGLNLGSVSVNVGTSSQQQQAEAQQFAHHSAERSQAEPATDFSTMLPAGLSPLGRANNGIVDYFA